MENETMFEEYRVGAITMTDRTNYIDRQTAYDVLTEFYHHTTDVQHMALHDALSKVPAAQGRWEYVDYGGVGNWHCSACRTINQKRTNFCPTCGRDMRGDYQ